MSKTVNMSRRQLFTERFGWFDTIILPLGTAVNIGIIAFLGSFWAWGRNISDTETLSTGLWSKVVLAHWGNQVVTLSSATIRAFIAFQTLVACYMFASIVLTKVKLSSDNEDKIMIFQSTNEGPWAMVLVLFRNGFSSRSNAFALATMAILVLVTIFSQLSSTLLLMDMAVQTTPGEVFERNVTYNSGGGPECSDPEAVPHQYALFAEVPIADMEKDGPVQSKNSDEPGYFDTNWVHRAFVPLLRHERENIVQYKGPANVLSMRDICYAPTLNTSAIQGGANLTFQLEKPQGQIQKYLLDVGAEFDYTEDTDWGEVGVDSHGIWKGEVLVEPMFSHQSLETSFTASYMVYKDAKRSEIDKDFIYENEWVTSKFDFNGRPSPSMPPPETIQLTYTHCFRSFNWTTRIVEIEGRQNMTEPTPSRWEFKDGRAPYNMTQVRQIYEREPITRIAKASEPYLLGRLDLEMPKIISSEPLSNPNMTQAGRMSSVNEHYYCDRGAGKGVFIGFCIGIKAMALARDKDNKLNCPFASIPSRPLVDLFNETLYATNHPAWGFQSLMTVLHSDSYYLNLPQFRQEWNETATIRLFTTASAPKQWTGFAIVSGVLAFHILLMYTVLILYLKSEASLKRVKIEPVKDYTLLGPGKDGLPTPLTGSRATLMRDDSFGSGRQPQVRQYADYTTAYDGGVGQRS